MTDHPVEAGLSSLPRRGRCSNCPAGAWQRLYTQSLHKATVAIDTVAIHGGYSCSRYSCPLERVNDRAHGLASAISLACREILLP